MTRVLPIFFSFLFSVLNIQLCFSQQKFSATIEPSEINIDEYATYRLVLENIQNIEKIAPPDFKNFEIISGPNQENGMSNINGKVSRYFAISYVLRPKTSGKFAIEGISAKAEGKAFVCNKAFLTINNRSTPNKNRSQQQSGGLFSILDHEETPKKNVDFNDLILRKGESLADKANKNLALKLITDKKTCYVGEPILATYKFYTRLKSESSISKSPSFNGFSVIDLVQPQNISIGSIENLNGRPFNVYTIRKAQLYPLQSGSIELETATMDNNVTFLKEDENSRNNANNFVNGFSLNPDALLTQKISISSKPVTVSIMPLPEKDKPTTFIGAVGNFTIDGRIEKTNFTTDETGTFFLSISGEGNLHLITPPAINWPQGIDAFDPTLSDNINKDAVPITGSKIYKYNFSVQKSGTYTIPSILYSFFDPKSATYKTVKTAPINFTVTTGTGKPSYSIPQNEIKNSDNNFAKAVSKYKWWFLGLLSLLFGILFFTSRKTKKAIVDKAKSTEEIEISYNKNVVAEKIIDNQKNPLAESAICLYSNDCNNFYSLLNKELKAFIATKCKIHIHEINENIIDTIMDKKCIDNNTAVELADIFKTIDWQLYTPYKNDNRHEIYRRAIAVVQNIRQKSI